MGSFISTKRESQLDIETYQNTLANQNILNIDVESELVTHENVLSLIISGQNSSRQVHRTMTVGFMCLDKKDEILAL